MANFKWDNLIAGKLGANLNANRPYFLGHTNKVRNGGGGLEYKPLVAVRKLLDIM